MSFCSLLIRSFILKLAVLTDLGDISKRDGAVMHSQVDFLRQLFLQHLGLWEESLRLGSGQAHAPPHRGPPEKEITFDPAYSQLM